MWEWLDKGKEWINKAINRVLGRSDVENLVVKNQQIHTTETDRLTSALLGDEISVAEWENGMRALIKQEYIQLYLLGRGGRSNMTRKDYSSIGGMLKEQYKYLSNFGDSISAGELTPGQILARAYMYINSSREAFNRAVGRAYGIPEGALPAYPGDGRSCLGMTNCKCGWRIEESIIGWDCYWELGEAEHCELCLDHEQEWNPYFIAKAEIGAVGKEPKPTPDREEILPKSWIAKALPVLLQIGVTAWLFSKLGKLFSVNKIDEETGSIEKAVQIVGDRLGLDDPLDDGWDTIEYYPDETGMNAGGSIVLKISETGLKGLQRAQQALTALSDIGMNVLILTVVVMLKGNQKWTGIGADLLAANSWQELGG